MDKIQKLLNEQKEDIIAFCQKLIQTKSPTCGEGEVAKLVQEKMQLLGYDEILQSDLGSIVGIIKGKKDSKKGGILFDAHMDTVDVLDSLEWKFPPFSASIDGGRIYGRGSSDMKGALASIIYAGFFAKKLDLVQDRDIIISASVAEEDFDSIALGHLIDEFKLNLHYAIICEPSDGKISLGHRGRAMIVVDTFGISAHGSAPQNGKNAVYEMQEIIKRVENLNNVLYAKKGEHGSVALSKIECQSASLNAIPSKATIYLDRRLAIGEDEESIKKEMDSLISGFDATWHILRASAKTYTNKDINMHTFFKAWQSSQDSVLAKSLGQAIKIQTGKEATYFKWDFATNGFATTARNIPTIGFGPGNIKSCHMRDEACEIKDVLDSCKIYTSLMWHLRG